MLGRVVPMYCDSEEPVLGRVVPMYSVPLESLCCTCRSYDGPVSYNISDSILVLAD